MTSRSFHRGDGRPVTAESDGYRLPQPGGLRRGPGHRARASSHRRHDRCEQCVIAGLARSRRTRASITSAASKRRQVLAPTPSRVSIGASTGASCSKPSEHPPLDTIIVLPAASCAQRWNCVRPAISSARCNKVIRVSPTPIMTIAPSYSPSARRGACTVSPSWPPTRSDASGPMALNDARGWSPRWRSGRREHRARNRAHVAVDGVRLRSRTRRGTREAPRSSSSPSRFAAVAGPHVVRREAPRVRGNEQGAPAVEKCVDHGVGAPLDACRTTAATSARTRRVRAAASSPMAASRSFRVTATPPSCRERATVTLVAAPA